MKTIIITAILFASVFGVSAQIKKTVLDVTFELSEEKDGKDENQEGLGFMPIGSDGKNIYSMSTKGAIVNGIPMGFAYVLNKYDVNGKLVLSEEIPMKTDNYKITYYTGYDFQIIGDRIIQTVVNRDGKDNVVYIVEYNNKTLKPMKEVTVATIPRIKGLELQTFTIADENEKDEFLVIVDHGGDQQFFILDAGLRNTFKVDVGMNKTIDKGDNVITSELNIDERYITCVNFLKRGRKSVESDVVKFFLIDRTNEDITEIELQFNEVGSDISDFECSVSEDYSSLSFAGFYFKNSEKNDDIGGTFTQIYDIKDQSLISQDVKEFVRDNENMTERQVEALEKREEKGKDTDRFEYLVRNVISNEDGSSLLIGEKYRFYTTTTTSSNRTTTTYHYIHADLIIVKTAKDGTIEWVEKFKKFNHAYTANEGGFLFHDAKSHFYIVYRENGVLKVAKISKQDGSSEAGDVFTKEDTGKYYVAVSLAQKMTDSSYVTQLARLKKARNLTIEFEEE